MGIIIDTSVFISWERAGSPIDFSPWRDEGETFISTITVSELLVGVHRATPESRRIKRARFTEMVIELITSLDVTVEVARVHAELSATLTITGNLIGLHDNWIAATAIQRDLAVLTANVSEFSRVPNLRVIPLSPPSSGVVWAGNRHPKCSHMMLWTLTKNPLTLTLSPQGRGEGT